MAKTIKIEKSVIPFGDEWKKEIKKMTKDKIINIWQKREHDLLKSNNVSFTLLDKKEVVVATSIVEFKHSITDAIMAEIRSDVETQMPIIYIYSGKWKDRAFKLGGRNIMELITKLLG